MIARREFVAGAGVAVAWSVAARAQRAPLPVIGYLSPSTPEAGAALAAAVRKGLSDAGLVEGRDFQSEFRWAHNSTDRLPGLAVELVERRVAVIVALGNVNAVRAAKAATTSIPIVFAIGTDPVAAGLVVSLSHPGGNITGINALNLDLGSKWVDMLHELLPAATRFAVLVKIENADSARSLIVGTQAGASARGLQLHFVFASRTAEIEPAFAAAASSQGLIVQPDTFFIETRERLAALAIDKRLPMLSAIPDFAKAGGLMSYGANFLEAHRQAGQYVARVLKGERAGDLPVQQATKFDLLINLRTAKAIGLEIPATLLARADGVIE